MKDVLDPTAFKYFFGRADHMRDQAAASLKGWLETPIAVRKFQFTEYGPSNQSFVEAGVG